MQKRRKTVEKRAKTSKKRTKNILFFLQTLTHFVTKTIFVPIKNKIRAKTAKYGISQTRRTRHRAQATSRKSGFERKQHQTKAALGKSGIKQKQ